VVPPATREPISLPLSERYLIAIWRKGDAVRSNEAIVDYGHPLSGRAGSGRIETQAKGSVVTAIRGAHRSVRSLSTVLNWKAKQVLECFRRAISMWFKSASIVALPNFAIALVAAAKLPSRSSRHSSIGEVVEARWRPSLIWTSLRSQCQHG